MNIAVDTNVLVRIFAKDDEAQNKIAVEALDGAAVVALTVPALCEMVWVLSRGYKLSAGDIAQAIRLLLNTRNVAVNRAAAAAGLAHLDAGGDFADGVVGHEGRLLGGDTFVSFDKKAVAIATKLGELARLLA